MVWIKGLNIGSGRLKICVFFIGVVWEEVLCEVVFVCEVGVDLVEWWVDYYCKVFFFDEVVEILVFIYEMFDGLLLLFMFCILVEGGE